jgi:hypothetical protein
VVTVKKKFRRPSGLVQNWCMLQSTRSSQRAVWRAAALTVGLSAVLGIGGASGEPSGPSAPPAATESDADECARREAIAESIARLESTRSAGQPLEDLAAEIATIEKRVIELPLAGGQTCRPALSIAGLTERFDPIRQDLATERRRRAINANPWPERIKLAVLENRIEIGMTREQVTAAWGQPRSVDVTPTSRQEQWTYGGPIYLYFTNGALVTIARARRPAE